MTEISFSRCSRVIWFTFWAAGMPLSFTTTGIIFRGSSRERELPKALFLNCSKSRSSRVSSCSGERPGFRSISIL